MAFQRQQGQVIKSLLQLIGLNAHDLAGWFGKDDSWASRRLSGSTPFLAVEIAGIAALLNLEPGVLYKTPEAVRESLVSTEWYSTTLDLQASKGKKRHLSVVDD